MRNSQSIKRAPAAIMCTQKSSSIGCGGGMTCGLSYLSAAAVPRLWRFLSKEGKAGYPESDRCGVQIKRLSELFGKSR